MTIRLQHKLCRAHRARSDRAYVDRVLNKTAQAARNVGLQQRYRADFKALAASTLLSLF
jgi:hypothetical protein